MNPAKRPGNEKMFVELLCSIGGRDPHRLYAIDVNGGRITYGELLNKARQICAWMRARGVNAGDRIVSIMDPSVDSVLTFAACALSGVIYVPLNVTYKGHMLSHAIMTVQPSIFIVDGVYLENLRGADFKNDIPIIARHIGIRNNHKESNTIEWETLFDTEPIEAGDIRRSKWNEIALLLLTSGTTGASKAVGISWLHLYFSCMRVCQLQELTENENIFSPWPLNHISGAIMPYATLLLGCKLTLRGKWSTTKLLDDLRSHGCTFLLLMGETVKYFSTMGDIKDTKLKHVFIAPVYDGIVNYLKDNGIKYCTNYNSTETNSPIGSAGYEPLPMWSCGRARDGVELRLVREDGEEVLEGEAGELLVRTSDPYSMAQGYWGMKDKTQERWKNGWFHTGDLLRKDEEGYFYMVSRKGDSIRTKGENVNSDELEFIVGGCDGVRECCVVGDRRYGIEDEIWLFVTVAKNKSVEEIRKFCEENLPKFMIPRYVKIVADLPVTPTGKIQRSIMREKVLAGEWDE